MQVLKRRLGGFLRMQACLMVMAGVLLGPRAVEAYRSSQIQLSGWSEEMASALQLEPGSRQLVLVNGEEFQFGVSLHPESVDEVLSSAERACKDGSGDLPELLLKLSNQPAAPDLAALDKLGILRRDSSAGGGVTSGDVACFVRKSDKSDDGSLLLGRLSRFAESMNAGELGEARYVHALRAPGSPVTRVLAVWTRSSLNFQRMLPDTGDSPGQDSPEIPRPPLARREFSGLARGSGHGAFTYVSGATPVELARFYEAELTKRGWTHVPFAEEGHELEHSRAFAQKGRAAFVSVSPDEDGEGTRVGIFVTTDRGESKDVKR